MKKKKVDWKKGSGEFIGFTISCVFLSLFLALIIGVTILNNTGEVMENAVSEIGREIVVCESLEEARSQAQSMAEQVLGPYDSIRAETIEADVDYAPGSDTEWKKGNFIKVFLSAELVSSSPATSGVKEVSAMLMIEKNGDN